MSHLALSGFSRLLAVFDSKLISKSFIASLLVSLGVFALNLFYLRTVIFSKDCANLASLTSAIKGWPFLS